MRKSIRTTLSFWFILVSLTPMLAVGYIGYRQRIDGVKIRESEKLKAIRDFKVGQINSWIQERKNDVKHLSTELEACIAHSGAGERLVHRASAGSLLQRFIKNHTLYDEIFIVDPKTGDILISTVKTAEGLNKSESPYYEKHPAGVDVLMTDIYYSKAIGRTTMCFFRPVFHSNGPGQSVSGILVSRIDLETSLFSLLLDNTGMGTTGETVIADSKRKVLCRLKYSSQPPMTLEDDSIAMVNAVSGETGIVQCNDYRGKKVMAAYTHVPGNQWGVLVKQDYREIFAPVKKAMIEISIVLVLMIAIFIVIAIFLAREIARPILDMTKVSERIMAGDLSARNSERRHSIEIDFLSRSFNEMTKSLTSGMIVQQGVSEINKIMLPASKLENLRDKLLKKLIQATDSIMGAYFIYDVIKKCYIHSTSFGVAGERVKSLPESLVNSLFGDPSSASAIHSIRNIPDNTVFTAKTFAGNLAPKEILSIPVMHESKVAGIISLASLTGYQDEHRKILEQIHPSISAVVSNLKADEKTKKYARRLEHQNMELESQTCELEAQAQSLKDMADALREQNEMLEIQQKKVETADRLKTEFLSNMSHELRTPLNSILTLSRVLIGKNSDGFDPADVEYLKIIHRNGGLLLELINDILDLSKIESGKMELKPEALSVGSVLSTIGERLKPIAEQKGVELIIRDAENAPEIVTDPMRINQILQNIIGNAVKFTEKGSVTVRLESDSEWIHIRVSDTGIGIPEDALTSIFEAFSQVDGSSSRNHEGTGLGLTIALKSAEMLGGSIDVESRPGVGTAFSVHLPVNGMTKKRGEQSETHVETVKPLPPGAERHYRKSLLLIEDNPDNMETLIAVIGDRYDRIIAADGMSGLDLAVSRLPDLILMDISLPGMDGISVVKHLKSNPKTKNIPAIALTAFAMKGDRERILASGFDDYVAKPLDPDTLMNTIERWIKKTEQRFMV